MAKRRNAPVVNNGLYRNLHKQVNQTGRQMKRVREEGYGGLDSAIRSVYKNAASTQKGFGKTLTGYQERQLGMVTKHLANSRAANRRVTHSTNKQLKALGGGPYMNEGMAQAVNTIERQAKNDARVGNVGARSLGLVADTAAQAMDVMQAGTREAQANAQTLAAESFSQRTNEDLATISQQHHEISMAKLQHVQQLEMLDKQMKMEQRAAKSAEAQAEKQLSKQVFASLKPQIAAVEQMIPTILSMKGSSHEEIVNALMAGGFGLDEADMPFVNTLVRQLTTKTQTGGADSQQMAAEVLDVLQTLPQWSSMQKKQKEAIKALLNRRFRGVALQTLLDRTPPGSGGAGGSAWFSVPTPATANQRADYSGGPLTDLGSFGYEAGVQAMSVLDWAADMLIRKD